MKNYKWCPHCRVSKDRKSFNSQGDAYDGLQGYCRQCQNIIGKGRYKAKKRKV